MHAIGPVIRVVGGEALDQIMQGLAYKAGQTFADQTALDNARGRWNLEAYEKAQQYETMLSQEEKARWDKFYQEVNNAPVVENPSKPGWGKVLLSGAAFLTGLDLVYNAYGAFQAGVGSNVQVLTYSDGSPSMGGVPGVFFAVSYNPDTKKYTYEVSFTTLDGEFKSNSRIVNSEPGLSYVHPWVTVTASSGGSYSSLHVGTGIDVSKPIEREVVADPSKMPVTVPEPVRPFPVIPGTTVPDLSPVFPQIQPDTVIEIDVPLTPTPLPRPLEVEPLTDTEWERLTNPIPEPEPEPEPEPDKPIDPNKPPEKPPYPGIKPGENPIPEVTPEYPEEIQNPEDATQGGLFSKLWEWLKAILDALIKILNAILALPFVLLELLWDFLLDIAKALFVPSDGFWDKNMDELKKVIWGDEMDDMIDDFESFASGGGGFFKDMVVSLMGVDGLVVIDAASINSILENIHSWVRGVIYPLLILFNVNSMYKLIRGTSLVEATRGLANRSKGAD